LRVSNPVERLVGVDPGLDIYFIGRGFEEMT
jgi:hypothetical protein